MTTPVPAHCGDGTYIRAATETAADIDAVLAELPAEAWVDQQVYRCTCRRAMIAVHRPCQRAVVVAGPATPGEVPHCCGAWATEVIHEEVGMASTVCAN